MMNQSELFVLLAHGSSDPDWSAHFVDITQQIRNQRDDVQLAYMELCEPSLEDIFQKASQSGITSLRVLPLFFARGRHLKVDVPKQLKKLEETFGINAELLPPVGEHDTLPQFLSGIIESTIERDLG